MGFVIVIDGPNFINELHRNDKGMDYVLNTLSFPILHEIIQRKLNENGLRGHPFIHTFFVCSDRGKIGPEFKGDNRNRFIDKLQRERGVTVDQIHQSVRGKEEQVDMSVFIRMLEMGPLARPQYDEWRHVVLISRDTDYVPAIRMLTQMGVHTIVIGFDSKENQFPIELINESYLFLDMGEILEEMEKKIKSN